MAWRCFLGLFCPQLVHLFFVGILLPIFIPVTVSSSLYSPDDPLWELDSSNFGHVYGKSNAWIIEFYNSWCGHCVRFAPTWKAFARDIQTWKNVIDVAVINCAESQNLKLCQKYDVTSYPTIRLFWINLSEDSDSNGSPLTGERDVTSMRHFVIKYLESHWSSSVPDSWPRLESVESESLSELWHDVPERINDIRIIIERPSSFVGREVILDFSSRKHPVIKRVLNTNTALLTHIKNFNNSSKTVLLKLGRDGGEELLHSFPASANETHIRDEMFEILAGYPRSSSSENLGQGKPDQSEGSKDHAVYMTDLENSLWYTLRQEISVHGHFSEPMLAALQSFLSVLKMYFPGSPPVMAYLNKLSNWANHQNFNLTGEGFLEALNELQTEKEFIPKMREWVGCKGSLPRYRGYPCSLWTLFHTLTVQAYSMYDTDPVYTKEDPQTVIFTIRDYVKYFFTCEECSRHFQTMAANLEDEVHNPQDAILWLWNAHNTVNRRLSGDATEDPQHLKVQFPPVELCKKCRKTRIAKDANQNILWDINAVRRFLLHFYGRQNIVKENGRLKMNLEGDSEASNSSHRNLRIQDTERVITSPDSSNFGNWNFRWFTTTDVSLCVSLYFVSALLLVIIYLLFTQRRKRRKSQLMKYLPMYP